MHHPKIIWAGLDDPKKEIRSTVEVLENHLAKLGIAKEDRPYEPHITLGRIKSLVNLKDLRDTIKIMTFEGQATERFEKIILYKSTLTPRGPVYEALEEFKIAPPLAGQKD
jgi:2'-5' RNA ligase